MIAVGSGGWFGQGWGRGTQSHLNFLPEHHTDFIFASLSEELGFVGSLTVLLLFGILFWRGVKVIWQSTSQLEVIITAGILAMLVIQTGINIAMNVGLAPVTGIPLPLVSYGGSSLLTTMAALGVIHSIYRQQSIESTNL
jgi:rod shape determining protein RodA